MWHDLDEKQNTESYQGVLGWFKKMIQAERDIENEMSKSQMFWHRTKIVFFFVGTMYILVNVVSWVTYFVGSSGSAYSEITVSQSSE